MAPRAPTSGGTVRRCGNRSSGGVLYLSVKSIFLSTSWSVAAQPVLGGAARLVWSEASFSTVRTGQTGSRAFFFFSPSTTLSRFGIRSSLPFLLFVSLSTVFLNFFSLPRDAILVIFPVRQRTANQPSKHPTPHIPPPFLSSLLSERQEGKADQNFSSFHFSFLSFGSVYFIQYLFRMICPFVAVLLLHLPPSSSFFFSFLSPFHQEMRTTGCLFLVRRTLLPRMRRFLSPSPETPDDSHYSHHHQSFLPEPEKLARWRYAFAQAAARATMLQL